MRLFHTQHDFRKGRIGKGMQGRVDTTAYMSSCRDAENMMVLSDGRLRRRWGTIIRAAVNEDGRLIPWDYSTVSTGRFLLFFSAGKLKIFDATMAVRFTASGQPWTAETMRYLQVANERTRLVITDETFKPKFLTFDPLAGTFALSDFSFETSPDDLTLRAPFFQFAPVTMTFSTTIFTAEGVSTGYASAISTASGISLSDFDLALGTGKLTSSAPYFTAAHVGVRVQLLNGEAEITAYNSTTSVNIKVYRDIARRLDNDPFYLRKNSSLIEVACFDHGLKVGDTVYFTGLADDESRTVMPAASPHATNNTTVPAPAATPVRYIVRRISDADHFEIRGAVQATGSKLVGGPDVFCFFLSGTRGLKEQVYSPARGWPQACATHERRLWLGGGGTLPDSAFGSVFGSFTNFDLGTGEPSDAVALFGIGEQARVRHLVSAFDLLILTDKSEVYIPGNTDSAITQETVRAVATTSHGSAYTPPRRFDGATFFVDTVGQSIREMTVESRETDYTAAPISVVVPEWVKKPDDSAVYSGAPNEATPYLIFANDADGSALVLHSARKDDSFGFMRWTLERGEFRSFAGLGSRLFAVGKRGSAYYLLEFDTQVSDYTTTDFAEKLTAGPATTNFTLTYHASDTLQLHSGGRSYSSVEVSALKAIVTPEAITTGYVGDSMPWSVVLHPAPVKSGQGPQSGKIRRLVSAEIFWDDTETGFVEGIPALMSQDEGLFGAPQPVNDWRQYHVGILDREPVLTIAGWSPGKVGLRAVTQNVSF